MKHWILLLACFWASVLLAETEKEFLERVDRALNKETQMARIDALGALYYRHGIDEQTARFVERVLGMLSERKGAQASLVEITDEEFRHVLNGYEYRPKPKTSICNVISGGAFSTKRSRMVAGK